VLVGDFLFSRSFELMVEDGSLKVLKILSGASAIIAEGEVNQLTARAGSISARNAISTSSAQRLPHLFAAACRIAAVVAERPRRRKWRSTPMAAISASPSSWSTTRSTMSRTRARWARTRATISARANPLCPSSSLMRAAALRTAFWKAAIEGHRSSDEDFAHAVSLIRSTRAVDDTLARARHYGQRAIDAIGSFAPSQAKDAMVEAVEFAVARAY
jgi:octaprenyl-diphosphate synthase